MKARFQHVRVWFGHTIPPTGLLTEAEVQPANMMKLWCNDGWSTIFTGRPPPWIKGGGSSLPLTPVKMRRQPRPGPSRSVQLHCVSRASALGRVLQQQSPDQGGRGRGSTAPSPPPPVINEFVLSVRPASCQPRSLLIKLPLANVLNTD